MTKAEYREYLKSDHWQHLRFRKLKHAKRCFFCGSKERPEFHHVRYRNITDCTPRDLKRVCPSCHDLYHWFEQDIRISGRVPTFEAVTSRIRQHLKRSRNLERNQQHKATKPRWNDGRYQSPHVSVSDKIDAIKSRILKALSNKRNV
jgi:hypothetical protein